MAYQFKIKLEGASKPPVWRRLLVPASYSFYQLHLAIQGAFGWYNGHLFQFNDGWDGDLRIGIPDDMGMGMGDDLDDDAEKINITEVFTHDKQKLEYLYDFGDSWTHLLTLEKITDEKIMQARCLAGKGACPPEDCGGIPGYYMLVEAVNDPKNSEHEDMREWLEMEEGEDWDVHAFSLEEANARMQQYLQE